MPKRKQKKTIFRFPLLPASSKIDQKALALNQNNYNLLETESIPQTKTEQRLTKIWANLLENSKFDIHEDFFELGG